MMLQIQALFAKAGVGLWDFLKLPDVNDEASFRSWVANLLKLSAALAEMTATALDDRAAALAAAIVSDDATWKELYALILAAAPAANDDRRVREALQARAASPTPGKLGMSFDQWVTLINGILSLLQQLFAK